MQQMMMYVDYDDVMEQIRIYQISTVIASLIVATVLGFITRHINESKGYDGGFAWGFWLGVIGLIVVCCRPTLYRSDYRNSNPELDSRLSALAAGKDPDAEYKRRWVCRKCGARNPEYLTTCSCGMGKSESYHQQILPKKPTEEEEIQRFRKMMDDGLITEEEFSAKKKKILGL